MDDVRLRLRALSIPTGIELTTEVASVTAPSNFNTDSLTLREVMNGCTLLDRAVVEDRIHVRAPLRDLVSMSDLCSGHLWAREPRPAGVVEGVRRVVAAPPGMPFVRSFSALAASCLRSTLRMRSGRNADRPP